jgi:hypothetical protein
MSFRCDLLDAAVSEEVLKALRPAELQLALAALQELEARDQGILRQWQMRLERAEYEVALAERRYQEVDPSNRLVANTLERRWNETLLHLQDLKKQAAEFQRQEARVFTPEQKAKVLALARDFPRLWNKTKITPVVCLKRFGTKAMYLWQTSSLHLPTLTMTVRRPMLVEAPRVRRRE